MDNPEAIHCIGCAKDISKSSRDRRKLVPDSTGNPVASSVWMEVSLQEATAAISLQSIQAIKKEREKSIAKALSIPRWKDGKNIPPSKERHDNFQLQAFQCVIL